MKIPKFAIECIVNRLHVSLSDEDIELHMRNRMTGGLTKSFRDRVVKYAIKHHKKNRELFFFVARGGH